MLFVWFLIFVNCNTVKITRVFRHGWSFWIPIDRMRWCIQVHLGWFNNVCCKCPFLLALEGSKLPLFSGYSLSIVLVFTFRFLDFIFIWSFAAFSFIYVGLLLTNGSHLRWSFQIRLLISSQCYSSRGKHDLIPFTRPCSSFSSPLRERKFDKFSLFEVNLIVWPILW